MASMCPHPDINEYYTVRHNAAGKELTKGIRGGKLGRRWLTITSFGKTDDGLTRGPRDYTHMDAVGRGKG
jgi:hypothetical protein